MNWKLIFQLSLFGLAMGIGTVFFIPPNIEPIIWLVIFLFCAYVIGGSVSSAGRSFLHGLLLGLVNCVWITGSHMLLFDRYIVNHPAEAKMMASMPNPDSPRLMMALVGPIVGVISGIIIGLLAMIAVKIRRPRVPAAPAAANQN